MRTSSTIALRTHKHQSPVGQGGDLFLAKYLIGDAVLHSHDAEKSTTSSTIVKLKTITISTLYKTPSTLRIKFDLKGSTGGGGEEGRIYKNGVAFGTLRTENTGAYQTFSEDLSYSATNTLELWARAPDGVGFPAYVRNFRVHGSASDLDLNSVIGDGRIGETTPFVAVNS